MRVRIALVVTLALAALVGVTGYVTSSPALCGSCHEMELRASAWKVSAHAETKCVSCHEPQHAWYSAPQTLFARGKLLGRDVQAHLANNQTGPIDRRKTGAAPMSNAVCLQCHSADRKVTSGDKVIIRHAEHAKANKYCVTCHLRTAHPEPLRGRSLSFMAQCFVCHGTPNYPKASIECGSCHPADFNMRPESHRSKQWTFSHGRVSTADRQQCTMCHKQSFCTDCHGLQMPHPAGWVNGKNGHSKAAGKDRTVCAQCHREKPDLCSMCHHKSYDPKKGSWIKQHFLEVKARGAGFCFQCHGPLYCSACHVGSSSK
jgi:Zn finger protein HypA/HybF involved in hydrogenase expression